MVNTRAQLNWSKTLTNLVVLIGLGVGLKYMINLKESNHQDPYTYCQELVRKAPDNARDYIKQNVIVGDQTCDEILGDYQTKSSN